MTQHALVCDEIVNAIDTLIRPRIDVIQDQIDAGKPLVAAYLQYRFDEIGARVSVVSDRTGHSSVHLYMVLNGRRTLSDRAAEAITQTYPDISVVELAGLRALVMVEKLKE